MTPSVEQGWAWLPQAPTAALVAGAVVAVVLVGAAVRNTPGSPARAALTAVLRLTSLAVLVVVLAGPSRTTAVARSIRHRVVLLVDDSASMGVRDGDGTRAGRAAAFVDRQIASAGAVRDDVELELRALGAPGVARPLAAPVDPAADGTSTDYLTALEVLAEEIPPAAVVLVGDGADRATLGRVHAAGDDEAIAARVHDLPFPVHTVAVGGPIERDLQVRLGPPPPFAFVRRPFDLVAEVRAEDLGGPVPVTLRLDGVVHATREVTLPRGGGSASAVFHVTPDATGYLTLEVLGPVPADDPLPHNNGDACTLRVIRDRTRVLQLAGSPSWDVRFLRRLLKGDPNIDLVSFFIMRTGPLHGRYRGSPLSLIEFPHDELFGEDLPGFDLVVLQNFTFENFPSFASSANAAYLDNLAAFVEEGGALLILGGDRSFADGGLAGSPLERVLPFDVPARAGSRDEVAAPVPTEAGLRHPVTALGAGVEATREAWAAMPAVQGRNRVGATVPGAAVLVTAGEGGDPLIAVREAGEGRVLAIPTDDTWRWGREAGSGALQYRSFWRGALRWLLAEEEVGRLELRVERETVPAGTPARVSVRALDEAYGPEPDATLALQVWALSGEEVLERRDGTTGPDGGWQVELADLPPGSYRAVATRSGAAEGPAAEARFTVRAEQEELLDPAARPALLAALARGTGGRALDAGDDLEGLLRELGPGTTVRRLSAAPAWDRPWWLLAVALPLAAEWLLRRRWGSR